MRPPDSALAVIHLSESLRAWPGDDFARVLSAELAALGAAAMPLQAGLSASSVALDDGISVMLLGAEATDAHVVARVGVFFSGLVAGCSCADDPTPVEAQPEYCELRVAIDRADAKADISLL